MELTILSIIEFVIEFTDIITAINNASTAKDPIIKRRFVCLDFEDIFPSSKDSREPTVIGTRLDKMSINIAAK